MNIHEKALEAATKAVIINRYGTQYILSNFECGNIQAEQEVARRAYLTTLLDSPEMAEKVVQAQTKAGDEWWKPSNNIHESEETYVAKAAIKAIKEEAGI